MPKRDYISAPATETLGLGGVIAGLIGDLDALRAGQITVSDAVARSMLAKQIFNGVRIYLNGSKLLSDAATPVFPAESGAGVCQGSEADTAQGNPATDEPQQPSKSDSSEGGAK